MSSCHSIRRTNDVLLCSTHVNPVQITAIYGSTSVKFSDFLAPGMIAIISFAHAIIMTAVSFVREK